MNQLTSQVRPESVLPLRFKRLKGTDLDIFEYFFLNGKLYAEVYHHSFLHRNLVKRGG